MSRALARDAFWTALGQGATAVGTLLGIRLLTEFVSPATYGLISLASGAAALTANMTCSPLTQAVVHLYPQWAAQNALGSLERAVTINAKKMFVWVAIGFALVAVWGAVFDSTVAWLVPLIVLLLLCDCRRSYETTLLNAARKHKVFSLWIASDAWLRPLLAVSAVWMFGQSAASVLAAYVLASLSLLVFFRRFRDARLLLRTDEHTDIRETAVSRRIWQYILPLIPLGLIDWTNGVFDRYVIGGFLSVADAGIYAAAYGLASRPFSMLGQSIELAVRPIYQAAVSSAQHQRADRMILLWFGAVTLAGVVGVSAITLWRQEIAALLLGPAFQRSSELLPWIAGGYALLAIAQVFQRVSFAYNDTRAVLWTQGAAAVFGCCATVIGTLNWGLKGAAVAVAICFAAQLAVAVFYARRSRRRTELFGIAQPVSTAQAKP